HWSVQLKKSAVSYDSDAHGASVRRAGAALPATSAVSWYQPATLRGGVALIRSKLGPSARISILSLASDHASATAVAGSNARDFQFVVGSAPQVTSTFVPAGQTIALATVDVNAPKRLLAELKRRFGIDAARIDQITLAGL